MLKNKKGSVLPFVLVSFFVAVVFSIALASNSLIQNSLSNNEIEQEQAFLSAKSMSDYIEDNIDSVFDEILFSEFTDITPSMLSGIATDDLGVIYAKMVEDGTASKESATRYRLSKKATFKNTSSTIDTIYERINIQAGNIVLSDSVDICNKPEKSKDSALVFPITASNGFSCIDGEHFTEDTPLNGYENDIKVAGGELNPVYVDSFNTYVPGYQPEITNPCIFGEVGNLTSCALPKFTEKSNERMVRLIGNGGKTDFVINVPVATTLYNEDAIDGDISNTKSTIKIAGTGIINIWLRPVNKSGLLYYTLPEIVKDAGSTATVNIIATDPGFNLVIFNNQDKTEKNSKGNGTVEANIYNHYGTVILASDTEKNNPNSIMGDVNVSGTIEANRLVVDATNRDNPFVVLSDKNSGERSIIVSLGHIE